MERTEQKGLILSIADQVEQLVQPLANLQIERANWEMHNGNTHPPMQILEDEGEYEFYLSSRIGELHVAIIAYLSLFENDALLKQFYSRFGETLDTYKAATTMVHLYEIDEYENTHLREVKSFLRGLNFYGSISTTQNEFQLAILERSLRSTGQICALNKTAIKKEKCIQDALKDYLQIIFPTTTGSNVVHPKINKKYFCDIYIEELGVGIEVKLSKTKTDLDSAFAGISDDVVGYENHPIFKKFYAVFYVTEDFLGTERFMATWKSRNYPNNWTPIYVIGKLLNT